MKEAVHSHGESNGYVSYAPKIDVPYHAGALISMIPPLVERDVDGVNLNSAILSAP